MRKNKIKELFFLVLRGLDFDSRIMDHYKGTKKPEKLNKIKKRTKKDRTINFKLIAKSLLLNR